MANSITIAGAGNGSVQLLNDNATPGASFYYGTDGGGTKGWFSIASSEVSSITGTAGQVLANGLTTPQTGAVTLTLAAALVSINSITATAATDLTLSAGSSGASLVLGQGASGVATVSNTAQKIARFTSTFPTTGSYVEYYDGANAATRGYVGWGTSLGMGNIANFGVAAASNLYLGSSSGAKNAVYTSTGNLLLDTTSDPASLSGGLVLNGSGAGATASSTTTGTLRVTGGAGISGALYVGGAGNFTGALSVGADSSFTPRIFINATSRNQFVGDGTGFAAGGGTNGLGIRNDQGSILFASGSSTFQASISSTALTIVPSTTSTSTTTGSLINGGGFGNAGKAYFGDLVNIRTSTAQAGLDIGATQANQASIFLRATDVGSVDWQLYRKSTNSLAFAFNGSDYFLLGSTGNLSLAGITSATTSLLGALVIGNGSAATSVGVGGGNINAGGTGTFGGALAVNGNITGAVSIAASDSLIVTRASSAASAYSLYVTTAGQQWQSGLRSGDSLYHLAYDNSLGSDRITVAGTTGNVNLTATTSATNSTTGALTIGNGTAATNVAIGGGNINAGGTLVVGGNAAFNSSTVSTSTSTGSLVVGGGVGVAGTIWALNTAVTASTTIFGATTDLDFTGASGLTTVSLTGNITFTSSGRAAGRGKVIRIISDASTRTLAFPVGWTFLGSSAPASIPASKVGILSVTFFGAADTDAVCAWAVQP